MCWGKHGGNKGRGGAPLAFMRLVHELKELVDNRLEKLPVRLEEARVLADNVHNVAGHDSLVVLAPLHLGEAEQVLDDGDEEPLLRLLVHGQGDGANGPAEHVAVVPRPLGAVNLAGELLRHDVLGIDHVQVGEVNEAFPDGLVQLHGIAFLDELAHNLSLVVFDNQDFLGANHALNHDDAQVGQDLVVLVLPERVVHEQRGVGGAAAGHAAANGHERVQVGNGQLLHLLVELLDELQPVVEADLEDFAVVNLGYPNQVVVAVKQVVSVR